jgi:hypothetical protein
MYAGSDPLYSLIITGASRARRFPFTAGKWERLYWISVSKVKEVCFMAATEQLSDKEVAALSAEIDRQLYALSSAPRLPLAVLRGEDGGGVPELHRKQLETLASATREPARSFLQRFLNTARSDLCDEGGGLHAQWKKWGDVENPEVIRTFAALLAGMDSPAAWFLRWWFRLR